MSAVDIIRNAPLAAKVASIAAFLLVAVLGAYAALGTGAQEPQDEQPRAADVTEGADEEQAVLYDYLIGNEWRTSANDCSMRFTREGRATRTAADGTSAELSFEIGDVLPDDNAPGKVPYCTAVCTVDGTPRILVLGSGEAGAPSDDVPVEAASYIDCSAFGADRLYRVTDDAFHVKELDSDKLAGLVGGKKGLQRFADEMRAFCSENVPLATSATWMREVTLDYASETARTTFSCNDAQSSTIAATIDTAEKSWSFSIER